MKLLRSKMMMDRISTIRTLKIVDFFSTCYYMIFTTVNYLHTYNFNLEPMGSQSVEILNPLELDFPETLIRPHVWSRRVIYLQLNRLRLTESCKRVSCNLTIVIDYLSLPWYYSNRPLNPLSSLFNIIYLIATHLLTVSKFV